MWHVEKCGPDLALTPPIALASYVVWSPDKVVQAWHFASEAHFGQNVPGRERAYIDHVGGVAMEVMAAIAGRDDVGRPDLAIQCALLHDVVEDTPVTVADIQEKFGKNVAAGVSALTKDESLGTKDEQMRDSLARIRQQPREVWMVKLADRITNLQPPPPHWSPEKIARYRQEAQLIYDELHEACPVLASRLAAKIAEYPDTIG